MATISVNCGHTAISGKPGYGAVSGKYKESEITRLVGKEVIRLLRAKGHTVHNSTVDSASSQNAYLKSAVSKANASGASLFISLHCNASAAHNANGMEVYTWKGNKTDVAVRTCYELSLKGFKNRGVKDGSELYVIKGTKMNAILIEMFFLDSKTDQTLYNKLGAKGIAKAIANAIV